LLSVDATGTGTGTGSPGPGLGVGPVLSCFSSDENQPTPASSEMLMANAKLPTVRQGTCRQSTLLFGTCYISNA
jgi:hypothetical protein